MIFKSDTDRKVAYHNTFSTGDGVRVLVDILGTLGFFDTSASDALSVEEQNILNLYSKRILERCGFWKPGNYERVVKSMLGIVEPKRKGLIRRTIERVKFWK